MSTDAWLEEKRFQEIVAHELVPQMKDAALCVSLAPSDNSLDAKFCVELGAMIMLDKPIVTVVAPGQTISEKLRMVSDHIIEADIATDAGREALTLAIKEIQESLDD